MFGLTHFWFLVSVIDFGQSFVFNDTQLVSNLDFIGPTLLRVSIGPTNATAIQVLLKPYPVSSEEYDKHIDGKCLMLGQVVNGSDIIGGAVVSLCVEPVVSSCSGFCAQIFKMK